MTIGWYLEEEQKEQMDFAHQEEMIKQFQVLLEEVDENLKASFKNVHQGNPTEILIRFLKASDWNVQRAYKMLLDCLQWIVQNNFVNILEKPVFSTDGLFRVVGDSEIVGFSGYSKERLQDKIKEMNAKFEMFEKDKNMIDLLIRCPSTTTEGYYLMVLQELKNEKKEILDKNARLKNTDGADLQAKEDLISQVISFNRKLEPRGREYVPMIMLAKCNACISVEDLLGENLKNMKNKFGKSHFASFPQGWKVCDGNNVPPYLNYLHEEMGGSVTANATLSEDMIALVPALFYAAIDEMHKMKLEDITNEDVMRKWGCVMRDSKKMGLDVEFAEEHLKKIAHAYFLSKGPVAESNKEELCSMSERESFDDGAPLSKGLLLFAPSEHSA